MLTKHPPIRPSNGASRNARHAEDHAELAFRALLRTFGLLRRTMEPYFSRFGISGSQWGVLRILHSSEEDGVRSLRVTDLSQRMLIRPPSVSGVVDRLEREGLVARNGEKDDLRARRVRLTSKGRSLVHQIMEKHRTKIHSVLGSLSAQQRKELHRLLDRLDSHLEKSLAPTARMGARNESEAAE